MSTIVSQVQPLLSIITTSYVPLPKSSKIGLEVEGPPLIAKEYGGMPPDSPKTSIQPSKSLAHFGEEVSILATKGGARLTIVVAALLQPFASVAVTEYWPLEVAETVGPVAAFDHNKTFAAVLELALKSTEAAAQPLGDWMMATVGNASTDRVKL